MRNNVKESIVRWMIAMLAVVAIEGEPNEVNLDHCRKASMNWVQIEERSQLVLDFL